MSIHEILAPRPSFPCGAATEDLMIYRQFELTTCEGRLVSTRVCWLDDARRLRVGQQVTLKERPACRWIVTARYQATLDGTQLHQTWHVGGL